MEYNTLITLSVLAYMVTAVYDIVTTSMVIKEGGRESNPILKKIIGEKPKLPALVGVKAVGGLIVAAACVISLEAGIGVGFGFAIGQLVVGSLNLKKALD